MIYKHITFCNKKYSYITYIAICNMIVVYLKTIYFFFFVFKFYLTT